jgi:hypothetical protein
MQDFARTKFERAGREGSSMLCSYLYDFDCLNSFNETSTIRTTSLVPFLTLADSPLNQSACHAVRHPMTHSSPDLVHYICNQVELQEETTMSNNSLDPSEDFAGPVTQVYCSMIRGGSL